MASSVNIGSSSFGGPGSRIMAWPGPSPGADVTRMPGAVPQRLANARAPWGIRAWRSTLAGGGASGRRCVQKARMAAALGINVKRVYVQSFTIGCVMAGLGGIFLEIFKDTAIRLAPVTKSEAMDMLSKLMAYPLLLGARGQKKSDIDALVDVICRVSNLLAEKPDIAEIDLNPVIVHEPGKGCSIVDCRVFFK